MCSLLEERLKTQRVSKAHAEAAIAALGDSSMDGPLLGLASPESSCQVTLMTASGGGGGGGVW